MKQIPITRGAVVIVDDDDYERINSRKWELNPEGCRYAVRKGSKRKGEPRTVQMHREILDAPPGVVIDHINGNGLDNRKCNLRFADTQKNAFNKKKARGKFTSKYKGVLKRKGKDTWTVRIKFNDRHIELGGHYKTEEYAAAIYNFASRIMFGEFRRENISDDIPELSLQEQVRIFYICDRYIERYGWYVDTETYRLFRFGASLDREAS